MHPFCSRSLLTMCVAVAWCLIAAGSAVAQGPPPVEVGDNHPVLPGEWPYGVTATNMNVNTIPGSVLDGAGSNTLKVAFPSAGPIKWTESRHNEGDISLLIGPSDPGDPASYPPDSYIENYAATTGGTTYAWRVARQKGGLLASVRVNGRDNGDTANGSPVGTIHGIAYFNQDFGQGWGYQMTDGAFANSGSSSADLQMGIAGASGGKDEACFDVAAAYFPYEEGWQGAWVTGQAGGNGEAVFAAGNPTVPETSVVWQGDFTKGRAFVKLPGVDSAVDGMLFVAPTNGGNNTRIAAAAPRDGGWDVTIRDDDNKDLTGGPDSVTAVGNAGFQFLYIPYNAYRLAGGRVLGATGALAEGASLNRLSVTRVGTGEYALAVKKLDGTTTATGDDGILVLSVAGRLAANTELADRAVLSYRYDDASSTFRVQSREVMPNTTGSFLDPVMLRDADFYVAFIDFENPVRYPEQNCADGLDNDGNGLTDCADPVCDPDPACLCNVPFADAEGNGTIGQHSDDGDIDQADFAVFQRCFSGPTGGISAELAYCQCFDRTGDGDVDNDDLDAFIKCISGPSVPWAASAECP